MPPAKKAAPKKEPVPVGDLDAVKSRINKRYGANTIISGDQLRGVTYERQGTGSLAFDIMLGGGFPLNVWNEIIGWESNGKTAMVAKTVAKAMADDPDYKCLWVASEDFVADWMEQLGVDLARVELAETNVTEEAFEIILDFLESKTVDAIILDSLPALSAGEEAEKTMEQASMALNAVLTGKFFRKAKTKGARSLVEDDRSFLAIIINQWREKIGIAYGDPRTTPGGKGKNFSFATRTEVARDSWLYEEIDKTTSDKVGIAMKAHTIKNKTAPQERVGVVDFYFDECRGFSPGSYDTGKEIAAIAIAADLVEKKSTWYHYGGDKWHGIEAFYAACYSEPELAAALSTEVRRYVLRDEAPAPAKVPAAPKLRRPTR